MIESPLFEEFWQRDVEESVRQKNVRPLVEEAALQVSNWGFSLADLKVHRKPLGKGILKWLKSLYGQAEESLSGFLGPIHIWLVSTTPYYLFQTLFNIPLNSVILCLLFNSNLLSRKHIRGAFISKTIRSF